MRSTTSSNLGASDDARAAARWRAVGASIPGASHEVTGIPCQDAHQLSILEPPAGQVLVAVVADGAGSASLSGRGSRLACDAALEQISAYVDGDPALTTLTDDHVHRWVEMCADRLQAMANALERPVRELACTLLIAVVSARRACFAQLGDGAIVAEANGVLDAMTWPQNGEFANTTLFVTDPKDRADLQVRFVEGMVGDVALFTDGVELLALRLQERRPHAPFFASLLESVRSLDPEDVPAAEASLGDFLASDRVRERTDDDLTLVLASRRPPGAPVLAPASRAIALVAVAADQAAEEPASAAPCSDDAGSVGSAVDRAADRTDARV